MLGAHACGLSMRDLSHTFGFGTVKPCEPLSIDIGSRLCTMLIVVGILVFSAFLLPHLAASSLTLPGEYSKLCYAKDCN